LTSPDSNGSIVVRKIERRGVDACHFNSCGYHTPAGFRLRIYY
jgi:hypothetical protein